MQSKLETLDALMRVGNGLAEALSIVCDKGASEPERQAAVSEAWTLCDKCDVSKLRVNVRLADGTSIPFQRGSLPSQPVDSIELRSKHVITMSMLERMTDAERIRALDEHRTPLGSATLAFPVHEGATRPEAPIQPAGATGKRRRAKQRVDA